MRIQGVPSAAYIPQAGAARSRAASTAPMRTDIVDTRGWIDYSELFHPENPGLPRLDLDKHRLHPRDVSVDDAVKRQLDSVQDFTTIRLWLPTEEELDAYREVLRAQGGNKAIDWGMLAVELPSGRGGNDNITKQVDYFASRYVALQGKIEANYSGDEKAGLLEKLNAVFEAEVGKMAQEFVEQIGGFFQENGFAEEMEKLREGVRYGFEQRRDELAQFAAANADYAGLNGSEDEWLRDDDAYMATRLRHAAGAGATQQAEAPAQREDAPYSLRDLEAAAKIAKEIPAEMYGSNLTSEEELGLRMAILTMKVEKFTASAGIGDDMQRIIRASVRKVQQKNLDAIDLKMLEMTKDPEWKLYNGECRPLDRSAIQAVYDKTMSTYEATGDFEQALKDGGDFGYKRYMEKKQNAAYNAAFRYSPRYQDITTGYWEAFYTPVDFTQNPFLHRQDVYTKHLKEWDAFLGSMESGSIQDFSIHISRVDDPYSFFSRPWVPGMYVDVFA